MTLPIALQLYTIRDFLQEDFEGTLEKVADMGYRHVELAGLYGRTPEQVRKVMAGLGLTVIAAHDGFDVLRTNLAATIDQARTLGYDLIICPWLDQKYQNPEGFREVARTLNDAAEKAASQGMTLCYHNHAFEFAPLADGSRGMDILFDKGIAPKLQSELDVYWVQKGGDDPLKWVEQLSGRVPLLHMKDMTDTPERDFAEVGTGVVDIKSLALAAPRHGVRYLIVEQDRNWAVTAMDSARLSLQNLQRMVA